jgi:putative tricarboxylic transport membrane protein
VRERKGTLISTGLLLAFAAAGFVLTLGFPAPAQPIDPGPAAFPRLIVGGLAIFALLQLLEPSKGEEPLPRGRQALKVVGVLVLLLVYAVVLKPLGFIVSTIIFLVGALILAGVRRPLPLVLMPVGLAVVLFYVFYELLRVSLPRGVIEGLLP